MIFIAGLVTGIAAMMILRVVLYRMNMRAYRRDMEIAEERLNELVEKELQNERIN